MTALTPTYDVNTIGYDIGNLETDRVLNTGGVGTNLAENVLAQSVSSLTRNVPVLLTRVWVTMYMTGVVNSVGWGADVSTLANGFTIQHNNQSTTILESCSTNREPLNQGWVNQASPVIFWGGTNDTIKFDYKFPHPVRIPANTDIITVTREIDDYTTNDVLEFYIGAEWYRDIN